MCQVQHKQGSTEGNFKLSSHLPGRFFKLLLSTHVPNHNTVSTPPLPPLPLLCVRVVLSINVCHAVKLMPTGCLHMMGCVGPPKRTAGGPAEMRVKKKKKNYVRISSVCVKEKERKIVQKKKSWGWGGVVRKAFLKRLWLQANQN